MTKIKGKCIYEHAMGQNAKESDENENAIAGMHSRGIFIWTKWLVFVRCPGTHAEKKNSGKLAISTHSIINI